MSRNGTLSTVANWYLNLGVTYGWLPVLVVTVIAFVTVWYTLGLLLNGGRS